MKKILYILIAITLLSTLMLSGCKSDETQTEQTEETGTQETTEAVESTDEQSTESVANTFPIVEETVTLTCLGLGYRSDIEDFETNAVTLYWEEKTGVHIEIETVGDDGAQEKLTVVMASGDLPDIILSTSVFSLELATSYGSQGLLLALNDLIDEYGVNTKSNIFEYDSSAEAAMTSPDGNIYFLPAYISNELSHTSTMAKCLVNTSWLDNLGLEIPTTTDEFYDMLVAFRDNDANDNGDASDEIPLAGVSSRIDSFLMNSFTYNSYERGDWLMVEDGIIECCCLADGYQEGLRYLNTLYSEGLMDEEIFLVDSSQLKLYTSDEDGSRIGSIQTYAYSTCMDTTTSVVDEYSFIEPLVGPTGLQQTPLTDEANIYANFVITSACEIPEIAFRWADAQLANALEDLDVMNGIYGPEGEGWAAAEEGDVGLDGTTAAIYEWLFTWSDTNNINYHEWGLRYAPAEWKLVMKSDQSEWNQETVLYNATVELYQPYAVSQNVSSHLMFTEDEAIEISQVQETLNAFIQEGIANFVTGSWDIDDDWENFKQELENIGLSEMIAIYQSVYDAQYGE